MKERAEVFIFACDFRKETTFKLVQIVQHIDAIEEIQFSRPAYEDRNTVKLVSDELSTQLASTADDQPSPSPVAGHTFFLKRLKLLSKDTVMLDAGAGTLTFYQGGYIQVHRVDLNKMFQSPTVSHLKVTSVVDIVQADREKIQLVMSDGSSKRMAFKFKIDDFMVNSIMKVLKKVLP